MGKSINLSIDKKSPRLGMDGIRSIKKACLGLLAMTALK
jgi:hypothetical protein